MSTELITGERPKFLTEEKVKLIKSMYCAKATAAEFEHFLEVCESRQLDPVLKQIHAVFRWSKQHNREIMSIQVGIDGFRAIADRTGLYAGSDKPAFEYLDTKNPDYPSSVSVTVYKMVQGQRCAFTAEAAWDEYFPENEKQQFFWRKMPRGQLAKCAETLALRKAFPSQLSGVYEPAEMDQAVDKIAPAPAVITGKKVDPEAVPTVPNSDYVIQAGKYAGKMLQDIPDPELSEYVRETKQKLSDPKFPKDQLENAKKVVEVIESYLYI